VKDHYNRQVVMFDWNRNLTDMDCPILAVVHATSKSKADKIIASGFAALAILDDGFYGKGMYYSSSATYIIPYFINSSEPCILICYVLPGNPYPVTEPPRASNNLVGHNLLNGYQSHYVVTRKDGLPFTAEDYSEHLRRFNEIVVSQEAQALPIFKIEIDNSNFNTLNPLYTMDVMNVDPDLHTHEINDLDVRNDAIKDGQSINDEDKEDKEDKEDQIERRRRRLARSPESEHSEHGEQSESSESSQSNKGDVVIELSDINRTKPVKEKKKKRFHRTKDAIFAR